MTHSVRRRLLLGAVLVVFIVVVAIAALLGAFGSAAQQAAGYIFDQGGVAYRWVLERQNHFALLGTVIAIIVGSYSLYKILINWNAVRRHLFRSYLQDEERGISARKTPVSRHFQVAKKHSSKFNTTDINSWIDDAISEFNAGELDDAKATLNSLNGKLQERIEFAAEQARIAKKQQAAIHLFLGSIEASKFKADGAIAEFQKTLALTNNNDVDAYKYIAEQEIARSEREVLDGVGGVHADHALKAATRMREIGETLRDRRIQAEASLLQGRAHLRLKTGRVAGKDCANYGIDLMNEVARFGLANDDGNPHRDDSLKGQLNELLGDAQVLLGGWKIADGAYAAAVSHFQKFDDLRKAIVQKKKAKAALHQTEEATQPWPHPNGDQLQVATH